MSVTKDNLKEVFKLGVLVTEKVKDALQKDLKDTNETVKDLRTDMEMADAKLAGDIAVLNETKADIRDVNVALSTLARQPGPPGKDYVLTENDLADIAAMIDVPVVEKVVTVKETPEEVLGQIEELKKDLKDVKDKPATRIGWGAHPLMIQGSGTVIDKVARIINFTGATVTRSPDGVVTVAISGGISTWSTPAEAVADDGSVTVFTVGTTAPTDVVSDGAFLKNGVGYTYSSPTITLTNGPTQFIMYR